MSLSDTDVYDDSAARPDAGGQPASQQAKVDLGAATHRGLVRPNNEDGYLVARASRKLEALLTNVPAGEVPAWTAEEIYGFVVADGMGGEAAGEVASRVALKSVVEHVLSTADWIMRDAAAHRDRIEERLAERFVAADEAVHREAQLHPQWTGMGTTMTLAVSSGKELFVGHVGDSRAYLLRAGHLQALTRDHSFAQQMADAGFISQQAVATNRFRNVLLRHLGGGDARADVQHVRLLKGDQLLLCTDGLSDLVDDAAIGRILLAASGAQAACNQLVEAALAAGGKDNVTVILARYSWPG
jgi:protein phosphatase